MSTVRRKRIAALVLAGAATLGLAFGGATSASADPVAPVANSNQYATFVATSADGYVAIRGDFVNTPVLSTTNITIAATCGTNVYTGKLRNDMLYDGWDRYVVYLPDSEAGSRCYVWGWSTNSSQKVVFEQSHVVKGRVVADATVVNRSSTGGL